MSEPANYYLGALTRRAPFIGVAWLVGGQFFLATALAYLTYSLFDWFDRKEADPKRQIAISAWLKGQPYDRIERKLTVMGAFYRLYGSPLLRIRGFIRASMVTLIVWAGYMLLVAAKANPEARVRFFLDSEFLPTFPIYLIGWVICDYISLLVIEKYLTRSKHLIFSLMWAFFIGVFFIFWFFVAIHLTIIMEMAIRLGVPFPYSAIYKMPVAIVRSFLIEPRMIILIEPPLLVHLWLLLFALGAVGSAFIYWCFRSVEGAQWLIKRGDQHPIRAIGLVAAPQVFVFVMAWPYLYRGIAMLFETLGLLIGGRP
jgi:hypothetical protein